MSDRENLRRLSALGAIPDYITIYPAGYCALNLHSDGIVTQTDRQIAGKIIEIHGATLLEAFCNPNLLIGKSMSTRWEGNVIRKTVGPITKVIFHTRNKS